MNPPLLLPPCFQHPRSLTSTALCLNDPQTPTHRQHQGQIPQCTCVRGQCPSVVDMQLFTGVSVSSHMTSARGVLRFIPEAHSYLSTLPSSMYSYPQKTENPTLTTACAQGQTVKVRAKRQDVLPRGWCEGNQARALRSCATEEDTCQIKRSG